VREFSELIFSLNPDNQPRIHQLRKGRTDRRFPFFDFGGNVARRKDPRVGLSQNVQKQSLGPQGKPLNVNGRIANDGKTRLMMRLPDSGH
jgi:hypothetical protein